MNKIDSIHWPICCICTFGAFLVSNSYGQPAFEIYGELVFIAKKLCQEIKKMVPLRAHLGIEVGYVNTTENPTGPADL